MCSLVPARHPWAWNQVLCTHGDRIAFPPIPAIAFHDLSKGRFEGVTYSLAVRDRIEEVHVDLKRGLHRGMAKLPRHKDHIHPLRDQETGEGVPEVVEPKTASAIESSAVDRRVEASRTTFR
jgi:hypothetical protein